MEKDYNPMYNELGVNIELHDQLMAELNKLHEKTHLSQTGRPQAMARFDQSFHNSHTERCAEILAYRKQGGKSVGTFCIYIPDEIALAAEVVTIPLCGGAGWSVSHADSMFPRDICPLIRSTFGMAFSGTCPYKKLKDFVVGETTCDAKKKAWDMLGFKVLEVPQRRNPIDRQLWLEEVYNFKKMMEDLSGVTVTVDSLREGIRLMNRKRKALQDINAFRKLPEPPISGLDALLVSQIALSQDVKAFIEDAEALVAELQDRANKGISAYDKPGIRVMMAGTPSPIGNAKVHHLVESSGMRIVADESCTGIRYYRGQIDETGDDLSTLMEAIADRYFGIDCACFSPNTERQENILQLVEDYKVQGVVQNVLQYCHTFNVEAKVIENRLKKIKIPSIKIETDYGQEDAGQIRTRLEAFREMVSDRL